MAQLHFLECPGKLRDRVTADSERARIKLPAARWGRKEGRGRVGGSGQVTAIKIMKSFCEETLKGRIQELVDWVSVPLSLTVQQSALGNLAMNSKFRFHAPRAQGPVCTFPSGQLPSEMSNNSEISKKSTLPPTSNPPGFFLHYRGNSSATYGLWHSAGWRGKVGQHKTPKRLPESQPCCPSR